MAPFKVAAKLGQAPGFAGPPNAKAAEALSKYIITDMYAKAVQGMPAEDVRQVGRGRAEEDLLGVTSISDCAETKSE